MNATYYLKNSSYYQPMRTKKRKCVSVRGKNHNDCYSSTHQEVYFSPNPTYQSHYRKINYRWLSNKQLPYTRN